MEFFLGYILFLMVSFSLFYLIIFSVKASSIYLYKKIKDYFFPIPIIPEHIFDQVLEEASEFVHSKHRPWGYDYLFAEYLEVSAWMLEQKWEELYGK